MKTHFTILIVSMVVSAAVQAQETESVVHTGSMRPYAEFGVLSPDLTDFNSSLGHAGYHEIDDFRQFEMGFRFKNSDARFGWSMAYHHLAALNNDQASFTPGAQTLQNRTLKGSGFKLTADYYIMDKHSMKLYVPVGITWSKYRVKTYENIPFDFAFANSRGVEENAFTSWKTSVDASLHFDKGILLKHVYVTFGVFAGYRYEIGGKPWRYSNELQIAFPELKNQGFFFGISGSFQGVYRHQETSTQIDL